MAKGDPPRYVQRASSSRGMGAGVQPPSYDASEMHRAGHTRPGGIDIAIDHSAMEGQAQIDDEGRIDVTLNVKKTLPPIPLEDTTSVWSEETSQGVWDCPPLNIVIFIVGSRGDVQPYLALAIRLITSHSHRVRIATHGVFESFVLSANSHLRGKMGRDGMALEGRLEFFDVGGDPKELMAYMVRNPGLLPGLPSLLAGEVGKKRKMTKEMLRGFYRSTFFPDARSAREFAADAIISNPPAFAHLHVAEALGVPLHMSFTMPWSATTAYKHPLVNIKESNAEAKLANYMSYALADSLMWQGLGDIINTFRTHVLRITSIPDRLGPGLTDRLKVPWTYCWSEGLLPRAKDWKRHIDVSGFYFLEDQKEFMPDGGLVEFLKGGKPPVYIGFGSVVIPDPEKTTAMIFDAIRHAGVRAIVHSGWAGLGQSGEPSPDIFVLKGDVPHDWLFAEGRVAAVCHHGGAGTTAIGLREGRPTIIVPFFGDQRFWGEAVCSAGAGPAPIPFKELSMERLAKALGFVVSPEVTEAAGRLGEQIRAEDGPQKGVDSFHRQLPLKNMLIANPAGAAAHDAIRCDVEPSRVAVWWSDEHCLKLSAAAAGVLAQEGLLDIKKLELHRSKEWDTTRHYTEFFTATGQATANVVTTTFTSIGQLFYSPVRGTVNTFWGIPEATLAVVGDMWEGMDNVPRMLGSAVRERGKVDSFTSGMAEGGKGLGFGLWDGVAGLVTEPIHGAKQEGFKGAVKGVGRSWINIMTRPTAGMLGFFVLPAQGSYRYIRSAINPEMESFNVLRGPRESASQAEASRLGPLQRRAILESFELLQKGSKERRKTRDGRRNRWFLIDKKETSGHMVHGSQTPTRVTSTSTASASGSGSGSGSGSTAPTSLSPVSPVSVSTTMSSAFSDAGPAAPARCGSSGPGWGRSESSEGASVQLEYQRRKEKRLKERAQANEV